MIANALRREARKALTNAARNNGGQMVRPFFFLLLSPLFCFFMYFLALAMTTFSLFPGEERALALLIDR